MYDQNNIFAKIIKGEIPSKKIYEDEYVLAFHDINPVAKTHVLVIPKGEYIDFSDFIAKAPQNLVSEFFQTVKKITDKLGLQDYKLLTNKGKKSGQVIFHFHVHIISNN